MPELLETPEFWPGTVFAMLLVLIVSGLKDGLRRTFQKHHQERRIQMLQITMKIDGMMCGMCESHINDTIRRLFPVKRVTSSHTKGQTVILSENRLDEEKLRTAVSETGYAVLSVKQVPYEKKGLFHR